MAKFPQKVTFTAALTIDTEGMDWKAATEYVQKVLNFAHRSQDFDLDLVGVTRMEIVEEDE